MSLAQFRGVTAKIPSQGLMKMGDSGACLASVAHNVDKNIPDDAPHAANIRGNSTRRPGCFHVVHVSFWVLMMRLAALLAR